MIFSGVGKNASFHKSLLKHRRTKKGRLWQADAQRQIFVHWSCTAAINCCAADDSLDSLPRIQAIRQVLYWICLLGNVETTFPRPKCFLAGRHRHRGHSASPKPILIKSFSNDKPLCILQCSTDKTSLSLHGPSAPPSSVPLPRFPGEKHWINSESL